MVSTENFNYIFGCLKHFAHVKRYHRIEITFKRRMYLLGSLNLIVVVRNSFEQNRHRALGRKHIKIHKCFVRPVLKKMAKKPKSLKGKNHLPVRKSEVVAEHVVGSQLDSLLRCDEQDVNSRSPIHAKVSFRRHCFPETIQPVHKTQCNKLGSHKINLHSL